VVGGDLAVASGQWSVFCGAALAAPFLFLLPAISGSTY
jgi:hypothetical protein